MKKIFIMSVIIAFTFIPLFSTFSQTKVEDNETLYILSDPYGNFKEKILVDWIRVKGSGKFNIEDPIRDLERVRKMYGDGEIEIKDGKVIVKGESKGVSDTYYRGNYKGNIPFSIKLKYFLNGKEESVDKIKGKNGKVRIEIEGENKFKLNGKDVPLIAMVTTSLEADKIRSLNISGDRKAMIMGRKYQVSLMLILDPEDKGFIEFESDKISLPEMIITVFPSYFSVEIPEPEIFDELKDGIDKLISLVKAQKIIVDETRKNLESGIKNMDFSQFDKLIEGINLIGDGIKSQRDLLLMISDKIDEEKLMKLKGLGRGVDNIISGLDKEKEGLKMLSSLMDGYIEITENILKLNKTSQNLAENTQSPVTMDLIKSLKKEEALIKILLDGGDLPDGRKIPSLSETKGNIDKLIEGVDDVVNSLKMLKEALSGVDELVDGNIEMKKTLITISEGGKINGIENPGLKGLSENLNSISIGLKKGLDSLSNELNTQFKGIIDVLKAISSSGKIMGRDVPGLSFTIKAMDEMKRGVDEGKKEIEEKKEKIKEKKDIVKKVKTLIGSPENSKGSLEFIVKINP